MNKTSFIIKYLISIFLKINFFFFYRIYSKKDYFKNINFFKKYIKNKIKKVGIISCHWIGDNFWAYQVMDILLQYFPNKDFIIFTKPNSYFIWKYYEKYHNFKIIITKEIISDRKRENISIKEFLLLIQRFKNKIDLVIDLTGNRYSAIFSFFIRPVYCIGFNGDEFNFIYSHCTKIKKELHKSYQPFQVISPLIGYFYIPSYLNPPKINITNIIIKKILKKYKIDLSKNIIIILPSAGWKEKEWNKENFRKLIKDIIKDINKENKNNFQIIIIGGKKDEDKCRYIGNIKKINKEIIKITGEDLDKVNFIISKASIFISNDTGFAHISASYNIPTIVLFNITSPKIYSPIGKKVYIISQKQEYEVIKNKIIKIIKENITKK